MSAVITPFPDVPARMLAEAVEADVRRRELAGELVRHAGDQLGRSIAEIQTLRMAAARMGLPRAAHIHLTQALHECEAARRALARAHHAASAALSEETYR